MQKIIGLLKSSSINPLSGPSLSPPIDLEPKGSQPQQSPLAGCRSHMAPCLQSLPAEIIHTILSFLPPISVAAVQQTSKHLRAHAENETLWMQLVKANLPEQTILPSPAPAKSWKDLYTAHHPYWFLTRHQLWFSDRLHSGNLAIARYDYRRGCIEAYPLYAGTSSINHLVETWEHDASVHIHRFQPEISLLLDDPVVKLDLKRRPANRLNKEVEMQTNREPRISSMLSLCTAIPPARQDPSMALWPPSRVPSVQRVRNQSSTKFRSDSHRPKRLADASDHTFRLRKFLHWNQPTNFIRMGENVSTFSTLLEESYTPTKSKPYQGIWVGDYSAHGCEFLLVMQTSHPPAFDISRRSSSGSGMLPSGLSITPRENDESTPRENNESSETPASENSNAPSIRDNESTEDAPLPEEPYIPSGRIEAIKLTGDENVPRGECTWFAEDIGDGGLVRIADEQRFRGARIVKSMGQVASPNFKNNRFIDSQLILISHDTVAQYWQRFGHISFYKRVNLDKYTWTGAARNEVDSS